MYKDRIEILNPGALYGINKLDKLGTSTIMESRNPTIVRILEEKGSVIENRHTGIPTMKSEMKKYNLPEPEFYEERGSFKVIFRNTLVSESEHQIEEVNIKIPKSEHQIEEVNIKIPKSEHQKRKCKSDYQQLTLLYCKEPKTLKEIGEYLNLSSRRYISSTIIKPLLKSGKLDYTIKNNIKDKRQKYITTIKVKRL